MSSIPLPALNIHPPAQQEGPLDQYSKMVQLKSALAGQQMQGVELQQRQQQLKDQQSMTAAMHDWDGKDINELPQIVIKHGASAQAVMGLKSTILEQRQKYATIAKDDAETGKNTLETLKSKNDMVAGGLNSVMQLPDEQIGQGLVSKAQEMATQGLIDPQHAQMAAQLAQLPPDQLKQKLKLFQKGFMSQTQQMDAALKEAEAFKNTQQGNEAQVGTQQKQLVLAGTNAQGVTADQQQNIGMKKRELAISAGRLAEEKRHNLKMEPLLSDDAMNMAADNYAQTGQMPSGMRSPAMVSQIIDRAAQRNPGGNIAANSAEYKANAASLKELQKNLDSVNAFENTANKNLDLFLDQAKKVVDTGSPFLNTPLRMINAKMLGSKDQAAYDTARQVAINEIAKVTGSPGLSGQLSDSARHEVEGFNPANATLAQTYRVAQVLRQDMDNRKQSYNDQIADIKKRINHAGGTQAKPSTANSPFSQFGGVAH